MENGCRLDIIKVKGDENFPRHLINPQSAERRFGRCNNPTRGRSFYRLEKKISADTKNWGAFGYNKEKGGRLPDPHNKIIIHSLNIK